jgi:hypothetical protein
MVSDAGTDELIHWAESGDSILGESQQDADPDEADLSPLNHW